MSLQHLAHHIAAKGRHGDDTLVHVSKDELAGLQALAKKHGTSLTVNPQTGLPEALALRQIVMHQGIVPRAARLVLGAN